MVKTLRTPAERFVGLVDYEFEPHHVAIVPASPDDPAASGNLRAAESPTTQGPIGLNPCADGELDHVTDDSVGHHAECRISVDGQSDGQDGQLVTNKRQLAMRRTA